MGRIVKIILLVCCIAGCGVLVAMNIFSGKKNDATAVLPHVSTDHSVWNKHVVDSAVALLRSGNIVLRMGLGADSYLLAQLNHKNKSYSHCGIVMIENGYPFVYHSIGGEDNPDERLRRDSACFFFSPLHNTCIAIAQYDYDTASISELGRVVREYYRLKPRFDLKFDLKTDDQLYCSEFVYKALNKAMKDTAYIATSTSFTGRQFVGIDNLFVNPHARLIFQIKFK